MNESIKNKCCKCIFFCYGEPPYKCALYKKQITNLEATQKTDCISFTTPKDYKTYQPKQDSKK